MNEYQKEQEQMAYCDKHYYGNWFADGYKIVTDRDLQLKGVDIITQKYGNLDAKFDGYESNTMFIELHNKHEYENSYIIGKEDGKLTDAILYFFQGILKARLYDYETVHKLALSIDKWAEETKTKLTYVKASGTTGMLVPASALGKPIAEWSFRRSNKIHIGKDSEGFLSLWFKYSRSKYYEEFANWLENIEKS